MSDFVSEPIVPLPGTFSTGPMGRGEPGVPQGFVWRGRAHEVRERLQSWKESGREGGRAGGELYLRRHCHRLLMHDGLVWTVYFIRQPMRGGNPKSRWFLYCIDQPIIREREEIETSSPRVRLQPLNSER